MRDEILAFLKRANELGGVVIDVCDTGASTAGIVRSFEPDEVVDVESTTDQILDIVKSDALGRSGKVRYELVGVRDGKRWGRQAVIIDAGTSTALGLEDATQAGITIECMRDRREIMRMSMGQTQQIMARMESMLAMQQEEKIELEKQRVQMFGLLEELTQAKHARELAAKEQEASHKQSQKLVEELTTLFPSFANRLIGHVKPDDPAAMAPEMISSLLGSLDEKQLEMIASALHPMQAAAFFEFMQATAKAKEAAEHKQLAASNGAKS